MIKDHLAKLGGLVGGARGFRAQADQMRDDRRFAEAAELYQRYLSLRPDDFGIWVQRGNCLKDSGALDAAKLAYERAIEVRPGDADVHLQVGHLMKLRGDLEAAIRAFRRSHTLDPAGGPAVGELRQLGVWVNVEVPAVAGPTPEGKRARTKSVRMKPPRTGPARIRSGAGAQVALSNIDTPELKGGPARLLDITDLLVFFDGNLHVTGIQRVECAIVKEILSAAGDPDFSDVVIAYFDRDDGTICALSPSRVLALIEAVGSKGVTSSELQQHLREVYASRRPVKPRTSDTYVILGAYWIVGDYVSVLLPLKNAGVSIGVYIYDLIPVTHPQFVALGDLGPLESLNDIIQLVDFVLTISEFVAKEVDSILLSELDRNIPVLAVPLSHELPEIQDEIDAGFAESLPREYVLCAGTLEGRKNHLLLLDAWSALNRKHGGQIPHLILVGKWGWLGEEFRRQLQARHNVDGKVIVVGRVSDAELKYLYEHSLFTVFPSFAEGWGLPVGESLAYGKPCIASSATSIPEVGGDFCRYIDPYDPLGATAEIERAIVDRAELQAWTDHVAKDFKIRTWAEVAHDLIRKTRRADALAREAPLRPAVTLEAGGLYQLTRPGLSGSFKNWSLKLVCAAGWRPFELWGCWSYLPKATLVFGSTLPPRTKVQVFLKLSLPPPTSTGAIRIKDWARASSTVFIPDGKPVWAMFQTETDERGDVNLLLERLGSVSHLQTDRELHIGISAVAYSAADDVAQRMDVLEGLFLMSNVPAG